MTTPIQGSATDAFLRFRDQDGNSLVSLNKDGSINTQGVRFPDGTEQTTAGAGGVTSIIAGSGISVDQATGDVTVSAAPAITASGIIKSGLLAEYQFSDGSGSTLTDDSGNGNNGTLSNSSIWGSSPQLGVNFDGVTHQYTITLPAALNAGQTFTFVIDRQPQYLDGKVGATYYNDYQCVLAGNGTLANSNALYITDNIPAQLTTPYIAGNKVTPATMAGGTIAATGASTPAVGKMILTWVLGVSSDQIYLNGQLVATGTGSQGLQTAGVYQFGGRSSILASYNSWFRGSVYYANAYNRQLSALEIQQNNAAIQQLMLARQVFTSGVPLGRLETSLPSLVIDGDSIQDVNGGWTQFATFDATDGQVLPLYVNRSGDSAVQMAQRSNLCVDQTFNPYGLNILCVLIGANSLGGPVSGVLDPLAGYCQHARGVGYFVVVATVLDQTGDDTAKNAVNQAIRQNWSKFADALCDLAANPLIGADGAASNATYFQGGLHPTAAGQALIGAMWQQVINRYVFGKGSYDVANVYTSSTTQADVDAFVVLGTSSGSQTFTLQTAQGSTGQRITIKNTDSHSWTVAADTTPPGGASAELINGASSATVTAGATLVLESFVLSPSTGGSGWAIIQNG